MISVNDIAINVTIFPDKTSQVWKLDQKIIEAFKDYKTTIKWQFESEAEFIHLLQLIDLVQATNEDANIVLVLPYLPYGRQDKDISNTATFALNTFCKHLCFLVSEVLVFDAHSKEMLYDYFNKVTIIDPSEEIEYAINDSGSDTVCFPDKGAAARYEINMPTVVMDKVRDQLTGDVCGIAITSGDALNKDIIIVDDLCDGGRTFIEAAKVLYAAGAKSVNLYVSHGIFSKGLDILREGGIMKIYTKDGLV